MSEFSRIYSKVDHQLPWKQELEGDLRCTTRYGSRGPPLLCVHQRPAQLRIFHVSPLCRWQLSVSYHQVSKWPEIAARGFEQTARMRNTLADGFQSIQVWGDSLQQEKEPHPWKLYYHGHTLKVTMSGKCLGVTLSDNLSWNQHCDALTKKASNSLAFFKRNMSNCPRTTKAQCYKSFFRPTL